MAVVEIEGLGKDFGSTKALNECDLVVDAGAIHAILGENGSGKSTLVKVLAGVLPPDRGTVSIAGSMVRTFSPRHLQERGVATVHQEVLNVPGRSVLSNVFLGSSPFGLTIARRRGARELARSTLDRLTSDHIDVRLDLEQLSLPQRQLVAIARALVRNPRVLVLDEATSALGLAERTNLFEVLADLRKTGCAIVYITHRMSEITDLADTVTVLRGGTDVARLPRRQASSDELLRLMSPTFTALAGPRSKPDPATGTAPRKPVLRASGIQLRPGSRPVELNLFPGEIVGMVGLDGHGQEEFLEVLAGIRGSATGSVRGGEASRRIANLRSAARAGVAYLPRDRKTEGIFGPLSILDNFGVVTLRRTSRFGLVRWPAVHRAFDLIARRLTISAPDVSAKITTLSGGNQQKVILARWLARDPRVLVLNDPTRGVDIASRTAFHTELREAAAKRHTAIVCLSTDLEELALISDRIVVFHRGEIRAELPGNAPTVEVMRAMFGQGTPGMHRV